MAQAEMGNDPMQPYSELASEPCSELAQFYMCCLCSSLWQRVQVKTTEHQRIGMCPEITWQLKEYGIEEPP